jgi:hypothetical protein
MLNISNRQPELEVENVESHAEIISIYNEIDEGTAQEVVDYFGEQVVAGKLIGQDKFWSAYQKRVASFITNTPDNLSGAPDNDPLSWYQYDLLGPRAHKFQNHDVGFIKYLYLHYQLEQSEKRIGYIPSNHVVSTCQQFTTKYSSVTSPSSFSPNRDIEFRIESEYTISMQLEEWFVKDGTTKMLCSSKYGPMYIEMPAFCPARYVIKEKLQGKNGYPIRVDRLRPRYNMAGDTAHIVVGNWELI